MAARVRARRVDVAKAARARSAMTRGYRGWETRRQREEEATVNLDPEMLALWAETKGAFHGTPHERAEQFQEYVEEHPDEHIRALQDEADRKLERLIMERTSAEGRTGPWMAKHVPKRLASPRPAKYTRTRRSR